MLKKINPFLFGIIFVLLVGLACSSSTEDISEAVNEAAATAVEEAQTITEPTKAPLVEQPTETTEAVPQETTAPLPAPEELELGAIGFYQGNDSILVNVSFIVSNPNEVFALESNEFQINVFDPDDNLIETSSGYIELVLPGQSLGHSTDVFLDEDEKANRVEIQLFSGDPEPLELDGPIFTTSQVTFIPNDYFPSVTGIVKNELNRNISNLRLTAVLFDADGAIIGGGYTYLNFLAPQAEAGVEISVDVSSRPETIILYASVSGLSVFEAASDEPPALQVLTYGAGQDDRELGVGFIVENIREDQDIANTEYLIAVYGENGNVLASEEGYIELVFAGEQQAVFTTTYLPEGETYDRIDIQLNPGKVQIMELDQSPFSSENLLFAPDSYFPKLSGVILNAHDEMITGFKVTVLAYDADDNIIGGGYQYADFIPASGSIPVELSVTLDGAPARFELSASLSGLTGFSDGSEDLLTITQTGFGQERDTVGVGYLVVNNDTDEAIPQSEYRVAAFDEAGFVIGVETGYLPIIFPGQETGFATNVYVMEGKTASRVEVQLYADDAEVLALPSSPLSVDQISFSASSFSKKVSGVLSNSHTAPFDSAYVFVIAYDANGNIIGGGYDYVYDTIGAESAVAFESTVYFSGEADHFDVFPALSRLE